MLTAQGILTYCTNGRSTVPMYADAARLLVFGAFLTSAVVIVRLSKSSCVAATAAEGLHRLFA